MAVMLTRSQRDGVYVFLLEDLAEMTDLVVALRSGDIDMAKRLRQWIEEDWRLLDEIGWVKVGTEDAYSITLPSDEIRTVFGRLHERARNSINHAMSEFANQVLKETFEVAQTSKMVLQELPGGTTGPRP